MSASDAYLRFGQAAIVAAEAFTDADWTAIRDERVTLTANRLAELREGQPVRLVRDGRAVEMTVQRSFHRDPSGFGSSDYANVTVGYGPGRFNTEVNAAGIHAGHYSLEVTS